MFGVKKLLLNICGGGGSRTLVQTCFLNSINEQHYKYTTYMLPTKFIFTKHQTFLKLSLCKQQKTTMADKGLVLKAIEAKLKGKSASKNFKENLASKWAEKIEKDEDIDSYIDDREDVLLEASAEADRRAVAAAKKAKDEKKDDVDEKADEEVKVDDDAPSWAKALIKQNQTLASRIETFESQQKSQTIQERFKKDERISALKGLPDHAFNGRIPKTEEEYEQAIEAFANDWKPFLEKHKLGDMGDDTPPSGKGGTTGGEVKKISADDAKAIVASMGSI